MKEEQKTLLCTRGSKPYRLKGSKVYMHLAQRFSAWYEDNSPWNSCNDKNHDDNETINKTRPKSVRWCASLTAVFIDWLDLFELVYQSFDLIGSTMLIWLIDWLTEWIQYIICPKFYISYLIEVCLIKYLTIKNLWDIWF